METISAEVKTRKVTLVHTCCDPECQYFFAYSFGNEAKCKLFDVLLSRIEHKDGIVHLRLKACHTFGVTSDDKESDKSVTD